MNDMIYISEIFDEMINNIKYIKISIYNLNKDKKKK